MKLGVKIADKVILEKAQKQKPGECACLIYTSGTTGMPKGCMLSHDNLTWLNIPADANMKEYSPNFENHNHRILSYLPLSHIAAFFCDVLS